MAIYSLKLAVVPNRNTDDHRDPVSNNPRIPKQPTGDQEIKAGLRGPKGERTKLVSVKTIVGIWVWLGLLWFLHIASTAYTHVQLVILKHRIEVISQEQLKRTERVYPVVTDKE